MYLLNELANKMKVYYVTISKKNIGCISFNKLDRMYGAYKIHSCDISDFKGQLLGSEWLD